MASTPSNRSAPRLVRLAVASFCGPIVETRALQDLRRTAHHSRHHDGVACGHATVAWSGRSGRHVRVRRQAQDARGTHQLQAANPGSHAKAASEAADACGPTGEPRRCRGRARDRPSHRRDQPRERGRPRPARGEHRLGLERPAEGDQAEGEIRRVLDERCLRTGHGQAVGIPGRARDEAEREGEVRAHRLGSGRPSLRQPCRRLGQAQPRARHDPGSRTAHRPEVRVSGRSRDLDRGQVAVLRHEQATRRHQDPELEGADWQVWW